MAWRALKLSMTNNDRGNRAAIGAGMSHSRPATAPRPKAWSMTGRSRSPRWRCIRSRLAGQPRARDNVARIQTAHKQAERRSVDARLFEHHRHQVIRREDQDRAGGGDPDPWQQVGRGGHAGPGCAVRRPAGATPRTTITLTAGDATVAKTERRPTREVRAAPSGQNRIAPVVAHTVSLSGAPEKRPPPGGLCDLTVSGVVRTRWATGRFSRAGRRPRRRCALWRGVPSTQRRRRQCVVACHWRWPSRVRP